MGSQSVQALLNLRAIAIDDLALASVVSRPGAVYASEDSLYVAARHYRQDFDTWFSGADREATTVHKFRLGVDAAPAVYVASGLVEGHVLNQFAMDEHEGFLRIATSNGMVPDPDVHSALSVLEDRGTELAVPETIVRLSVGIESVDDLIADVDQALASL